LKMTGNLGLKKININNDIFFLFFVSFTILIYSETTERSHMARGNNITVLSTLLNSSTVPFGLQ
jgi:hypothetical protein